jgi:glycosyltransferase involved in cell wall biosynthesis
MDSPLKILMLNYEYPPIGGGGGNAHRHLLTEYAKQENLHIDVLTSFPHPGHSTESFSENITIYKVGIHKKNLHYWRKTEVLEWLFKANRKLKTMLAEKQYDLAHAFFGFPTGWLTYRHRTKLPYLISLRGSDVPGANPRLALEYKLLGGLFRKIWKNADLLVANSSGLAQRAKQFAPFLNYKVIPNGIDTDRFVPAQNKPPLKPFKLIAVGRLSQVKRLDVAIQAIHRARDLGLDVEITAVGDGNLMDELKNLAEKLGITDCVHFTGWLEPDQIPECYQSHHAFLLTSINEGMNNAMLEAMASGLPIISTACEGTQELVTDNGLIISDPTPENIAKAIIEIAKDPKRYDQMAELSQKMAEKFSWANTAEQYLELYKNI